MPILGGPSGIIDAESRWEHARWLLADDALKPEDRVAGPLVLPYAQWPAVISRLTLSDVEISDTEVHGCIPAVSPSFPEPLARSCWNWSPPAGAMRRDFECRAAGAEPAAQVRGDLSVQSLPWAPGPRP